MAEGIVSDLAVKVLELLGKSAAQKIAPYFGGRSKLSDLQQKMEMIQARLADAERRQEAEQGEVIKVWLKRLKHVMYRLEDLLEEVAIKDHEDNEQEEMDSKMSSSSKLSKMVCCFPSMLSSLKLNKLLSDEAESINKELDSITRNMEILRFNDSLVDKERGELNHIRNLKEEMDLFIGEQEVIGRDEEKEEIVNMVLESCDYDGGELSVICIVGMGGLGKTTLAHLVYDDKRVQDCFECRYWACISDQVSSFQDLGGKVLHSITKQDCRGLNAQELESSLTEAVKGKKFLMVLDDLWDDDHNKWLCLKRSLRGGKPGSKILVTTRSELVAKNMGVVQPCVLKGLSEEKSWELFERIAFMDGKERANPRLKGIGREIVNKCGNVPLAIRTLAGLLCSRGDEEYWVHIRDTEIAMMEETQVQDRVEKILKISYDHLRPHQKQCFAYCSLFPEDHIFDVERLIQLWMAQGYVKSFDDGHMCFMELLRRSFFQNFTMDRYYGMLGIRCQMHDLMRDLARSVGNECCSLNREQGHVNNNIRHVMICNRGWLGSPSLHALPLVRSYLIYRNDPYSRLIMHDQHNGLNLNDMLSSFRRLRALELGKCNNLPNSIRQLKHLRYLGVAVTSEFLPDWITKLHYLQTLDLEGSIGLTELPRAFYKLTSLKHLRLGLMSPLEDMPPKFANLVSLQSVDIFIVGNNNGLDALARMNLVGFLRIEFKKNRENAVSEAKMASLKEKKLNYLELLWPDSEEYEVDEELLECLQPPPTLSALRVENWKGTRFPNWGIDVLPNLEHLTMENCKRCRHIPPLIQWSHLKELYIEGCEELEWWEVKDEDGEPGKGSAANPSAWASLKSLHSLTVLRISKLNSLPRDIGELPMLQDLRIGELVNLETLPESIGNLTQLRDLWISDCPKLEGLPKSIQNLTSLQQIWIRRCPLLMTRCEEPNGADWPLIQHIPQRAIFD